MVSQAGAGLQRYYSDTSRQFPPGTDMDLIVDWFLNEVTWFAIYSCILGVVMLAGTYVSIMLFNFAAHSQVRNADCKALVVMLDINFLDKSLKIVLFRFSE